MILLGGGPSVLFLGMWNSAVSCPARPVRVQIAEAQLVVSHYDGHLSLEQKGQESASSGGSGGDRTYGVHDHSEDCILPDRAEIGLSTGANRALADW